MSYKATLNQPIRTKLPSSPSEDMRSLSCLDLEHLGVSTRCMETPSHRTHPHKFSPLQVRKPHSDGFLALKEIRCTHPSLGKTLDERSRALGRLMTEVNMVREQLRHSNVVTYHKCFQEGV